MGLLRAAAMGLAVLLAWAPARAEEAACPVPDDLAMHGIALPAAKAAVATGRLVILAVGGAASAGMAARGEDFTYPARLAARLRMALPKLDVRVVSKAAAGRSAADAVEHLGADIAASGARLVIWAPGAIEAGTGTDAMALGVQVDLGVARIRAAGADPMLIDLQYAPSIARVIDLPPYRDAVLRAANSDEVPVLDRYELMKRWGEDGVFDLDATDSQARVAMARRLFDCLAAVLAGGIVEAVR